MAMDFSKLGQVIAQNYAQGRESVRQEKMRQDQADMALNQALKVAKFKQTLDLDTQQKLINAQLKAFEKMRESGKTTTQTPDAPKSNIPSGIPGIQPDLDIGGTPQQPIGATSGAVPPVVSNAVKGGSPQPSVERYIPAIENIGKKGASLFKENSAWTDQQKLQQEAQNKAIGRESKKREMWDKEVTERNIKFDIMDAKQQFFMDVGGRAYFELKTVAKDDFGVDLDFEKGGFEAIKNKLIKMGFQAAKLAPLMTALDRLRPELGFEMMRQIGPFRATQAAKDFENTIAQFSGDIREDIANMTTTMAKNVANIELLDENGMRVSTEETVRRMKTAEATMVRKYNYMYRNMGLTTKPYTSGISLEDIAKTSNYNQAEENIIQNAISDNPDFSRTKIIVKMMKKGIL